MRAQSSLPTDIPHSIALRLHERTERCIKTDQESAGLVAAVASSILAAMIIAALYFGREIFVPVALAILLTFVLAPAVQALQHIRVPRRVAVVGVVLCAFACRHVEKLQFLHVMFGDRPALPPPEIFYQRMLAADPEEAAEKAEQFLKESSLASYYDQVALPGLRLAQNDADRGALHADLQAKLRDSVHEFIADLANIDEEEDDVVPTTDAEAATAVDRTKEEANIKRMPVLKREDLARGWDGQHPVLCVAGRSMLDEAAALVMAHLGTTHAIPARSEPSEALANTNIVQLQPDGVQIICLIHMGDEAPSRTHFAIRRLRRRMPKARIVLCCWLDRVDDEAAERRRIEARADLAGSSQAVRWQSS